MGKPKLTLKEVDSICSSFGWTLLSKEYVNYRGSLDLKCERGHESSKSLEKVKEGRGCIHCRAEDQRVDIETAKKEFAKLGLTLLDESYKDAHTNMSTLCERGHYIEKTWHSVRKGDSCRECKHEDMIGEGNHNYNHDLPDELRGIQRNYPEYYEWRRQVLKKDNYTCVACNERGGKITAHHILNYSEHIELRTDVDNGVTFCVECHNKFHKKYGRRNNTKEQLDEFLKQ